MKLSHSQKVKMARRMQTWVELKYHVPLFSSKMWTERSEAIRHRLNMIQDNARMRVMPPFNIDVSSWSNVAASQGDGIKAETKSWWSKFITAIKNLWAR